MYKDIKSGGRKKATKKRTFALEVLEAGENSILKSGSIIPIHGDITIGRKESNLLVLDDHFVSGNHARIFIKNTDYMIEDLGSTNGTKVNDKPLEGKIVLRLGDEIEVGSAVFKVIG
jgi:pSer/pThr/pTyr-binding forkhead associated (FHA) protein